MRNWFLNNYDKLILIFSVIVVIFQFLITKEYFFDSKDIDNQFNQFKITTFNNEKYLEPSKDTHIMPGEYLYYKNIDSTEWKKEKITNVRLIKRQEAVLTTTENNEITGTLVADFSLEENWSKSVNSISIRQKRDTIFVPLKKVEEVYCRQRIKLPESLSDFDWKNHEISFFQRLDIFSIENDLSRNKPKWTTVNTEINSTKYDLFTPPIIFLDQGKLTARLPEIEKPQELEEPFGLELESAEKAPYFLRLASWVGSTPYFEDKTSPISVNSPRFTRNRLDVGKTYKRDTDRKPGQPSLIECAESDPDCLVKVEHFVVQQHRNPQTGGLRMVGRSLVRDYLLGGEPFEINSVMENVFAGDYTFIFSFSLPSHDEQTVEITSKDEGKIFSFAGRNYEVVKIDLEMNQITLKKKDPRVLENTEKVFNFASR